MGNFEMEFIDERRRQLDDFLKKLGRIPHIYYSDDVKVFLREVTSDMEKVNISHPSYLT